MAFERWNIVFWTVLSWKSVEFRMKSVDGAKKRIKDGVTFGIELEQRRERLGTRIPRGIFRGQGSVSRRGKK